MATQLAIEAKDPRQLARFFANLWEAEICEEGGACIARRPDGCSELAVEPHQPIHDYHYLAPHVSIRTHLNAETVMAMCRAEGRPAKMCQRCGHFGVVEVADLYTVATIFTAL